MDYAGTVNALSDKAGESSESPSLLSGLYCAAQMQLFWLAIRT
jgi:hypothetical protein